MKKIFVLISLMLIATLLAACASTPVPPSITSTSTITPILPPPPLATITASPIPLPTSTETPLPVATMTPTQIPVKPLDFSAACWVDYSPTNYDPNTAVLPNEDSIRADLQTLQGAGVTGLVTYSSTTPLGESIPRIAQELGYSALIIGVWDPTNEAELAQAIAEGNNPIAAGFVVGNEGLDKRYDLPTLARAIDRIRQATGKPVTTTEEIGDYSSTDLLNLGDWVFPNAHPFFAGQIEPSLAVKWTQTQYDTLQKKASGKTVIFKEVGLPSAGDPQKVLSQAGQAQYYQQLRTSGVNFAYFEAFDQPWKQDPSVEPFWGFFQADRTPKMAARYLCSGVAPTPAADTFNVFTDGDSPDNHFIPSGFMGDTGDIQITETWEQNPQSGKTAIRVVYIPMGKGPNSCRYTPPCKWAGIYWLQPADNWGVKANAGFDLSKYHTLKFWARSDTGAVVTFGVGGVAGQYPDSIQPVYNPNPAKTILTPEWKEYTIPLTDADTSYVIGGFSLALSSDDNPVKQMIYLDNIRFEK